MAWISASFELEAQAAEAVSDALLEHGALCVDLSDAAGDAPGGRALFGEPGATVYPWARQRISALFAQQADVRGMVQAALDSLGLHAASELTLTAVAEQDWVRSSEQQFVPIEITPRLWIVPSWSSPPQPDAVNLRLDPGQAFGTGAHPTTWQCLHWLDGKLQAGASVLDYGCGSGVLAIAALKLGARRAVAVDIDPVALETTRANADANGVHVETAPPDRVPPVPYDVVLANILANPLRVLAPLLAGLVRPGGRIVLAGILATQADEVSCTYRPWIELHQASERDGWVCLSGVRGL